MRKEQRFERRASTRRRLLSTSLNVEALEERALLAGVDEGLIGHYRFEGDFNDSSPAANHGFGTNSPGFGESGFSEFGDALDLSGNSTIDDPLHNAVLFEIPDPIPQSAGNIEEFSFALWAFAPVVGFGGSTQLFNTFGECMNRAPTAQERVAGNHLSIDGEGKVFYTVFGESGTWPNSPSHKWTTVETLDFDSGWHHIAGSFDRGEFEMYIDGTRVDTTVEYRNGNQTLASDPTVTYMANSTDEIEVGAHKAFCNGPELFHHNSGQVDELRLYDRTISAAEATELASTPIDLDRGLIGHYQFEGNFNDSSPLANHGTGVNSPDFAVSTVTLGNGLRISGNSVGTDTHVAVSDPPELGQLEQFSFSVWVNADHDDETQMILSQGGDCSDVLAAAERGQSIRVSINTNADAIGFTALGGAGVFPNSPAHNIGTIASGLTNTWRHIVGTFDGGELQLFVDGELVAGDANFTDGQGNVSATPTVTHLADSPADILVGIHTEHCNGFGNGGAAQGFPTEFNRHFNGGIDELRFYNRILTSGEVVELAEVPSLTDERDQSWSINDFITVSANVELLPNLGTDGEIATLTDVLVTLLPGQNDDEAFATLSIGQATGYDEDGDLRTVESFVIEDVSVAVDTSGLGVGSNRIIELKDALIDFAELGNRNGTVEGSISVTATSAELFPDVPEIDASADYLVGQILVTANGNDAAGTLNLSALQAGVQIGESVRLLTNDVQLVWDPTATDPTTTLATLGASRLDFPATPDFPSTVVDGVTVRRNGVSVDSFEINVPSNFDEEIAQGPLPDGSAVSGRVWFDRLQDGQFNSSAEEGLKDIDLQIVDSASGNVVQQLTTSEDGSYEFQIPPGTYFVHVLKPNHEGHSRFTLGGDSAVIDQSGATDIFTVIADQELTINAAFQESQAVMRPILLVPGIAGTYAKDIENDIQWLMHRGSQPDELQIDPLANAYNDTIASLEATGYVRGVDLFVANYDWRLPPAPSPTDGNFDGVVSGISAASITNGTFEYGVDYLGYWMQKAQEAWADEGRGPLTSIDVIAHSTGGLVTRAYIQSPAYEAVGTNGQALPKIENFIQVGVPNRGASKAWNAIHDNWAIDPAYQLVLSKILYRVWIEVNQNSRTVEGPGGTIAGPINPEDFIEAYVPTIRGLLATYPFLESANELTTVNDQADKRNDLLLDLNNGLDSSFNLSAELFATAAASSLTDPSPFASQTGRDVIIAGSGVETPTTVQPHDNPTTGVLGLFDVSTVAAMDDFSKQVPDKPWYQDIPSALGGDSTVPLVSSIGQFIHDDRFELAVYSSSLSAADGFAGVPLEESRDAAEHLAIMVLPETQRKMLDVLGRPGFSSLISTGLKTNSVLDRLTAARNALDVGPRGLDYRNVVLDQAKKFISGIIDPVQTKITDADGNVLVSYDSESGVVTSDDSVLWGGEYGHFVITGDIALPLQVELTEIPNVPNGRDYFVHFAAGGAISGGINLSGTLPESGKLIETIDSDVFEILHRVRDGISDLLQFDALQIRGQGVGVTVNEDGSVNVSGTIGLQADNAAILPNSATEVLDGLVTVENFNGSINVATGRIEMTADEASFHVEKVISASAANSADETQPGIELVIDPTNSNPAKRFLATLNNLDVTIPALPDMPNDVLQLDSISVRPNGFDIEASLGGAGTDFEFDRALRLTANDVTVALNLHATFETVEGSVIPRVQLSDDSSLTLTSTMAEVSISNVYVTIEDGADTGVSALVGDVDLSDGSTTLEVDRVSGMVGSAILFGADNATLFLNTTGDILTADAANIDLSVGPNLVTLQTTGLHIGRDGEVSVSGAETAANAGILTAFGMAGILPFDVYRVQLQAIDTDGDAQVDPIVLNRDADQNGLPDGEYNIVVDGAFNFESWSSTGLNPTVTVGDVARLEGNEFSVDFRMINGEVVPWNVGPIKLGLADNGNSDDQLDGFTGELTLGGYEDGSWQPQVSGFLTVNLQQDDDQGALADLRMDILPSSSLTMTDGKAALRILGAIQFDSNTTGSYFGVALQDARLAFWLTMDVETTDTDPFTKVTDFSVGLGEFSLAEFQVEFENLLQLTATDIILDLNPGATEPIGSIHSVAIVVDPDSPIAGLNQTEVTVNNAGLFTDKIVFGSVTDNGPDVSVLLDGTFHADPADDSSLAVMRVDDFKMTVTDLEIGWTAGSIDPLVGGTLPTIPFTNANVSSIDLRADEAVLFPNANGTGQGLATSRGIMGSFSDERLELTVDETFGDAFGLIDFAIPTSTLRVGPGWPSSVPILETPEQSTVSLPLLGGESVSLTTDGFKIHRNGDISVITAEAVAANGILTGIGLGGILPVDVSRVAIDIDGETDIVLNRDANEDGLPDGDFSIFVDGSFDFSSIEVATRLTPSVTVGGTEQAEGSSFQTEFRWINGEIQPYNYGPIVVGLSGNPIDDLFIDGDVELGAYQAGKWIPNLGGSFTGQLLTDDQVVEQLTITIDPGSELDFDDSQADLSLLGTVVFDSGSEIAFGGVDLSQLATKFTLDLGVRTTSESPYVEVTHFDAGVGQFSVDELTFDIGELFQLKISEIVLDVKPAAGAPIGSIGNIELLVHQNSPLVGLDEWKAQISNAALYRNRLEFSSDASDGPDAVFHLSGLLHADPTDADSTALALVSDLHVELTDLVIPFDGLNPFENDIPTVSAGIGGLSFSIAEAVLLPEAPVNLSNPSGLAKIQDVEGTVRPDGSIELDVGSLNMRLLDTIDITATESTLLLARSSTQPLLTVGHATMTLPVLHDEIGLQATGLRVDRDGQLSVVQAVAEANAGFLTGIGFGGILPVDLTGVSIVGTEANPVVLNRDVNGDGLPDGEFGVIVDGEFDLSLFTAAGLTPTVQIGTARAGEFDGVTFRYSDGQIRPWDTGEITLGLSGRPIPELEISGSLTLPGYSGGHWGTHVSGSFTGQLTNDDNSVQGSLMMSVDSDTSSLLIDENGGKLFLDGQITFGAGVSGSYGGLSLSGVNLGFQMIVDTRFTNHAPYVELEEFSASITDTSVSELEIHFANLFTITAHGVDKQIPAPTNSDVAIGSFASFSVSIHPDGPLAGLDDLNATVSAQEGEFFSDSIHLSQVEFMLDGELSIGDQQVLDVEQIRLALTDIVIPGDYASGSLNVLTTNVGGVSLTLDGEAQLLKGNETVSATAKGLTARFEDADADTDLDVVIDVDQVSAQFFNEIFIFHIAPSATDDKAATMILPNPFIGGLTDLTATEELLDVHGAATMGVEFFDEKTIELSVDQFEILRNGVFSFKSASIGTADGLVDALGVAGGLLPLDLTLVEIAAADDQRVAINPLEPITDPNAPVIDIDDITVDLHGLVDFDVFDVLPFRPVFSIGDKSVEDGQNELNLKFAVNDIGPFLANPIPANLPTFQILEAAVVRMGISGFGLGPFVVRGSDSETASISLGGYVDGVWQSTVTVDLGFGWDGDETHKIELDGGVNLNATAEYYLPNDDFNAEPNPNPGAATIVMNVADFSGSLALGNLELLGDGSLAPQDLLGDSNNEGWGFGFENAGINFDLQFAVRIDPVNGLRIEPVNDTNGGTLPFFKFNDIHVERLALDLGGIMQFWTAPTDGGPSEGLDVGAIFQMDAFRTDPEGNIAGGEFLTFGELGVTFGGDDSPLGTLGGRARNWALGWNPNPQPITFGDFEVAVPIDLIQKANSELTIDVPEKGAFGLPDWLPVAVDETGIRFPDTFGDIIGSVPNFDDADEIGRHAINALTNFVLIFSGGVRQAPNSDWPIYFEFEKLEVSVDLLHQYATQIGNRIEDEWADDTVNDPANDGQDIRLEDLYERDGAISVIHALGPRLLTELDPDTIQPDGEFGLFPLKLSGIRAGIEFDIQTVTVVGGLGFGIIGVDTDGDNVDDEHVMYGEIVGGLSGGVVGLGAHVILTEHGPILAKMNARVPVPIGALVGAAIGVWFFGVGAAVGANIGEQTGFYLDDFDGAFVFDGVPLPVIQQPLDLLEKPEMRFPAEISQAGIRNAIRGLFLKTDANGDPIMEDGNFVEHAGGPLKTWDKGVKMVSSGRLTNKHVGNVVGGTVTLGANIGFSESDLIAVTEGLVVGAQLDDSVTSSELSDESVIGGDFNPFPFGFQLYGFGDIDVFGQGIADSGLLFNFSNPLSPSLTMAARVPQSGSLFSMLLPVEGEIGFTLATDGVMAGSLVAMQNFVASLIDSGLNEFQESFVDIAAELERDHENAFAQALLDLNSDGEVSFSEDLQVIDLAFVVNRLEEIFLSLNLNSVPTTFDELTGEFEVAFTASGELLRALIEKRGPEFAQNLIQYSLAAFNAGNEAYFDTINPSLTINGSIQPVLLGIPIGDPLSSLEVVIDKTQVLVRGDDLRLTAAMLSAINAGAPLLFPIHDATSLGMSIPFDNLLRDLALGTFPELDPTRSWQGTFQGTATVYNLIDLGDMSGLVFPAITEVDENGWIVPEDHPLATHVQIATNDLIEDGEVRFGPDSAIGDAIIVLQEDFDRMAEHGGILLDARMTLPQFLTDPFGWFGYLNDRGLEIVSDENGDIRKDSEGNPICSTQLSSAFGCFLSNPSGFLELAMDLPAIIGAEHQLAQTQFFVPNIGDELQEFISGQASTDAYLAKYEAQQRTVFETAQSITAADVNILVNSGISATEAGDSELTAAEIDVLVAHRRAALEASPLELKTLVVSDELTTLFASENATQLATAVSDLLGDNADSFLQTLADATYLRGQIGTNKAQLDENGNAVAVCNAGETDAACQPPTTGKFLGIDFGGASIESLPSGGDGRVLSVTGFFPPLEVGQTEDEHNGLRFTGQIDTSGAYPKAGGTFAFGDVDGAPNTPDLSLLSKLLHAIDVGEFGTTGLESFAQVGDWLTSGVPQGNGGATFHVYTPGFAPDLSATVEPDRLLREIKRHGGFAVDASLSLTNSFGSIDGNADFAVLLDASSPNGFRFEGSFAGWGNLTVVNPLTGTQLFDVSFGGTDNPILTGGINEFGCLTVQFAQYEPMDFALAPGACGLHLIVNDIIVEEPSGSPFTVEVPVRIEGFPDDFWLNSPAPPPMFLKYDVTAQDATEGIDYEIENLTNAGVGELRFERSDVQIDSASGQRYVAGVINVSILNDDLLELDESVLIEFVQFTNPTSSNLSELATLSLTITDSNFVVPPRPNDSTLFFDFQDDAVNLEIVSDPLSAMNFTTTPNPAPVRFLDSQDSQVQSTQGIPDDSNASNAGLAVAKSVSSIMQTTGPKPGFEFTIRADADYVPSRIEFWDLPQPGDEWLLEVVVGDQDPVVIPFASVNEVTSTSPSNAHELLVGWRRLRAEMWNEGVCVAGLLGSVNVDLPQARPCFLTDTDVTFRLVPIASRSGPTQSIALLGTRQRRVDNVALFGRIQQSGGSFENDFHQFDDAVNGRVSIDITTGPGRIVYTPGTPDPGTVDPIPFRDMSAHFTLVGATETTVVKVTVEGRPAESGVLNFTSFVSATGFGALDMSAAGEVGGRFWFGGNVSSITADRIADGTRFDVGGTESDELSFVANGAIGDWDMNYAGHLEQLAAESFTGGQLSGGSLGDAVARSGDFSLSVNLDGGFDSISASHDVNSPEIMAGDDSGRIAAGGEIAVDEVTISGDLMSIVSSGGGINTNLTADRVTEISSTNASAPTDDADIQGNFSLKSVDMLMTTGGDLTGTVVTSDAEHNTLEIVVESDARGNGGKIITRNSLHIAGGIAELTAESINVSLVAGGVVETITVGQNTVGSLEGFLRAGRFSRVQVDGSAAVVFEATMSATELNGEQAIGTVLVRGDWLGGALQTEPGAEIGAVTLDGELAAPLLLDTDSVDAFTLDGVTQTLTLEEEFIISPPDTVPPTVVTSVPMVIHDQGSTFAAISRLELWFSEAVDSLDARLATNYSLIGGGPNGFLGDVDDVTFSVAPKFIARTDFVVLDVDNGPLRPGMYRLTIDGENLHDLGRLALDGNGDTLPGGRYSRTFVIDTLGDFDGNGAVDAFDIDFLAEQIRGGAADSRSDLNDDGEVTSEDLDHLVLVVLGAKFGDANLDGVVDATDFGIWFDNRFSTGGWSSGDFNYDGLVDARDFNIWNQNKFTGDVDRNGIVDAADIDYLGQQIRSGSTDPWLDSNNDGKVTVEDLDHLVLDVLMTDYGDANLDGVIDGTDLGSWFSHRFTAGGWASGDFNYDGLVDVQDFNIWNQNKFTDVAAAALHVRAPMRLPRAPLGEPLSAPLTIEHSLESLSAETTRIKTTSNGRAREFIVDSGRAAHMETYMSKTQKQRAVAKNRHSMTSRRHVRTMDHALIEEVFARVTAPDEFNWWRTEPQ